ncbi:small metal-binding protein SmbP [Methylomonas sp. MgM2]
MKLLTIIILGLLLSVSRLTLAEDHTSVALKHAKEAIEYGQMGHSPMIVEHAEAALDQVNMALKDAKGENKKHLEAAAKSLNASIEHGKMAHAEIATASAEEAVEHLKQTSRTNADAAEMAIESKEAVENIKQSTQSKGVEAVTGEGKAATAEKAIEAPDTQKSESKDK